MVFHAKAEKPSNNGGGGIIYATCVKMGKIAGIQAKVKEFADRARESAPKLKSDNRHESGFQKKKLVGTGQKAQRKRRIP